MVEYKTGRTDTEVEGCLVELKVTIDHEGEMDRETLEKLDDVMLSLGSSRTGQRVGVTSTDMKKVASARYTYQETLMARSLGNATTRLEVQKGFERPSIHIGTGVFELKETDERGS